MRISQLPFIKVCCISSPEEAALALSAGASALGLVSAMPSGPGVIKEGMIAEIARAVPPPVATFLLTAQESAEEIIRQHRFCQTTTLQLVDRVSSQELSKLRQALPGIKLVQVIHVTGPESMDEALSVAPLMDALLLDSGNQQLPVKELGGTGRTHDWSVSRKIRDRVQKPVFLAGGINAENVADAIATVQPFGIDLCSGVRSEGALDPLKLAAFFAAVSGTLVQGLRI